MTTKKCLYCGRELYTNPKVAARQKYCSIKLTGRDCGRKHWRATHPEEYRKQVLAECLKRKTNPRLRANAKESSRKYNSSPRGRYKNYKNTARMAGREFSLTEDQFNSFWNQKCAYCGEQVNGVGVDRIDNSKGYVMDNCCSCCITCNNMKKTLTKESFIKKCSQIAKLFAYVSTGAA